MGSHSVTCHPIQDYVPHLNPSQAGWYLTYLPQRNEAELIGVDGCILSWFICPQRVIHPNSNY